MKWDVSGNSPLWKAQGWTACVHFSLPATFSVFWLRAVIVLSVYFSVYDPVEFSVQRHFFGLLITDTYLMAPEKRQQFLSTSCFFLNANTAASVERRTKLKAVFFFVFFLTRQRKSLRKSRWAKYLATFKFVETQSSHCEAKIRHNSPTQWRQRERRCWGGCRGMSGLRWAVSPLSGSSAGRRWQAAAFP